MLSIDSLFLQYSVNFYLIRYNIDKKTANFLVNCDVVAGDRLGTYDLWVMSRGELPTAPPRKGYKKRTL